MGRMYAKVFETRPEGGLTMKRLTFEGNFCDISMCGEVQGGSFCEDGVCSQRKIWEQLKKIEDILGSEYDLERLHELAQAGREGRVRIEEKTYQCPKCGAYRLTPRLDNLYYFCFKCKTQFTKEQAETAPRREQE